MHFVDLAVRQGEQLYLVVGGPFEEFGRVFLIAGKAVQALGHDDVKPARSDVSLKPLIFGAVFGGA